MARHTTLVRAVTVAVRRSIPSKAISPNTSPLRSNVVICFPFFVTFSFPLSKT